MQQEHVGQWEREDTPSGEESLHDAPVARELRSYRPHITDLFYKKRTVKEILDEVNAMFEETFKYQFYTLTSRKRPLERLLKEWGLGRHKGPKSVPEIEKIKRIMRETIVTHGRDAGYRSFQHELMYVHNVCISQRMTMALLREVDPEGVAIRTQRRLQRVGAYYATGPNHHWAFDGHEKLYFFNCKV
jgi:hypothetical protein